MFVGLAILILIIAALYPGYKMYREEKLLGKRRDEERKKAQEIAELETSLVNLQDTVQSVISQCKKRKSA